MLKKVGLTMALAACLAACSTQQQQASTKDVSAVANAVKASEQNVVTQTRKVKILDLEHTTLEAPKVKEEKSSGFWGGVGNFLGSALSVGVGVGGGSGGVGVGASVGKVFGGSNTSSSEVTTEKVDGVKITYLDKGAQNTVYQAGLLCAYKKGAAELVAQYVTEDSYRVTIKPNGTCVQSSR